jgi:hypothetical protein
MLLHIRLSAVEKFREKASSYVVWNLNMKPKTWTHPKFSLLQRRLHICPALAAGILEGIWHLAATFDPEGGRLPYTDDELAAWLGVDLAADELLAALVDGRWIDDDDNGLRVHDWEEHRPSYVDKRVKEQSRYRKRQTSADLDRPAQTCAEPDRPAETCIPSASASVCKTEVTNVTSSQQRGAAGIPSGKVFVLPLTGGCSYRVPGERIDEYRAAYSWDVSAEVAKAALWLKDNPARRPKTHRAAAAFLTRWMNRRDDKEPAHGDTPAVSADDYKRDLARRHAKTMAYVNGNGIGDSK